MTLLATAYGLALASLFSVAAAHKVRSVALGSAAEEPLLQLTRKRAENATALLVTAATAEIGAAVLLVAVPVAGLTVAVALLLFYWLELRHLPRKASCNCFGQAIAAGSVRFARWRNMTLATLAAFAIPAVASPASLDLASLPGAASLAAVIVAIPAARGVLSGANFNRQKRRQKGWRVQWRLLTSSSNGRS